MSKARFVVNALALIVLTLGVSSIANAQATRTWVSVLATTQTHVAVLRPAKPSREPFRRQQPKVRSRSWFRRLWGR